MGLLVQTALLIWIDILIKYLSALGLSCSSDGRMKIPKEIIIGIFLIGGYVEDQTVKVG
jgi:hypothetical protein